MIPFCKKNHNHSTEITRSHPCLRQRKHSFLLLLGRYVICAFTRAILLAALPCRAIDTTPPQIYAGDDITIEATGPRTTLSERIAIQFTVSPSPLPSPPPSGFPPSVYDNEDPNPKVTVTSGQSGYPPGIQSVTFTATDASGNSASDSISAEIVDTTPPAVEPLPSKFIEATGPLTFVNLPVPRVSDIVDPAPAITNNSVVPSEYGLGTHSVTFTATDGSGNSANTVFNFTIVDSTPPTIIAPNNQLHAANGVDTPAEIPLPASYDAVTSPVSIEAIIHFQTGDQVVTGLPVIRDFPVGRTSITFTATDSAGNASTASMLITVADIQLTHRSGVIGDAGKDLITGAHPIDQQSAYHQVLSLALTDVVVAPTNLRAYGVTSDAKLVAFDVSTDGQGVPQLSASLGSPVDLSSDLQNPTSIEISKDARYAYIADRTTIIAVNLVKQAVNSPGIPIEIKDPYQYIRKLTPEPGRKVVKLRVHPNGDRLYALLEGNNGNQTNGFPDNDYGRIAVIDIQSDLAPIVAGAGASITGDPGNFSVIDLYPIQLPVISNAKAFYGPHSMDITPDGNLALITAEGGQGTLISPFGILPDSDDDTGGVLVMDLNSHEFIQHVPPVIHKDRSARLRINMRLKGLQTEHPVVTEWRHVGDGAAVEVGAQSLNLTHGLDSTLFQQSLANNYVYNVLDHVFKDFGLLKAYNETFATDMVAASDIAVSPKGDLGLVTFKSTNNVALLSLEPSNDLRGWSLANIPEFSFDAAISKTVNGLDLGFGVDQSPTGQLYGWLRPRDIDFTGDGSHAFVGMSGGDAAFPRRFGLIDIDEFKEEAALNRGALAEVGLNPAVIMPLYGSDSTVLDFSIPRSVATFSATDVDADGVSDHVEAFNRFNDLKPIHFGDKDQLVSTNTYNIADPGIARQDDVFPNDYSDSGYFLPHSGPGYRYAYDGHVDYSTNVGAEVAIRTLEQVGSIWHENHIFSKPGFADHAYFVVTDMSVPGEGLIQNQDGEYRHFNVRNGLQVNIHYFRKVAVATSPTTTVFVPTDMPLDFVLSNGPGTPLDNTILSDPNAFDWEPTLRLIQLFLNESAVEKVVIDPSVRDIIYNQTSSSSNPVDLAIDPRIEIHGFNDFSLADNDGIDNNGDGAIDEPGELRDNRVEANNDGIDNDNDFVVDEADEVANLSRRDMDAYMMVVFRKARISVEGSTILAVSPDGGVTANTLVLASDTNSSLQSVKIDIGNSQAAFVQLHHLGNPSAYELFLDQAMTQPVADGALLAIEDFQGVLWLNVLGPTTLPTDIGLRVDVIEHNGLPVDQVVYFAGTVQIDVDVDSDNTNGFLPPDRSTAEEASESSTAKLLMVNNGDVDADSIPDFADGFNLDQSRGTSDDRNRDGLADHLDDGSPGVQFVPLVVEVAGTIDMSLNPVFNIDYDDSIPRHIDHQPGKDFILPITGSLRLWLKDGNDVTREATDFIGSGEHHATRLGFSNSVTAVTLYVEAVANVADAAISISLDPDGYAGPASFIASDSVRVTTPATTALNLAIDSNNDGSIDPNDEDIEDVANAPDLPGHILSVNNLVTNVNGIPDFADFSGSAVKAFSRVEFALPAGVDPNVALVTISYSASNPNEVMATGNSPPLYVPAAGHLRLWTKDANQPRDPGLDYVGPGVYPASQLPASGVLYLEAIEPSADIADQRILMQLDPDGADGSKHFVYEDAVRVTIYRERWEDIFAQGAVYRRVNIDGQPIPESEPQSAIETDRPKQNFYVDSHSLTPVYAVTDISIPTLGPDLRIEFRRTVSVSSWHAKTGTSEIAVNGVAEDNVLGMAWRTNIGMRIVRDQGKFYLYDENGQLHRFNASGRAMPRSFRETESHRSDLQIDFNPANPGAILEITWTRNFLSTYHFRPFEPDPAEFGDRPIVGQLFRLEAIRDRNHNAVIYNYPDITAAYPDEIHEEKFPEKKLSFTYQFLSGFGKRLSQVEDPFGNRYLYEYPGVSFGNVQEVRFPPPGTPQGQYVLSGTRDQYQYDFSNSVDLGDGTAVVFIGLSQIINPNNHTTAFAYTLVDHPGTTYDDKTRRLVLSNITTAVGTPAESIVNFTEISTSLYGRTHEITDSRGTVWTWEFGTIALPSSLATGIGYALNGFTVPALTYLRRSLAISQNPITPNSTSQLEWELTFSKDTFCNLLRVVDPDANVKKWSYGKKDGFDHTRYSRPSLRIVDPEGLAIQTLFRYDHVSRRLAGAVSPRYFTEDGESEDFFRTVYSYDDRSNLIQSESPYLDENDTTKRRVKKFRYDEFGIVSHSMDPDGRLMSNARSVNSAKDGWSDMSVIYREYADNVDIDTINFGLLTPLVTRAKAFDLNGNPVKESVTYTDHDGNTVTDITEFLFDAANNLVEIKQPQVFDADSGIDQSPLIQRVYDGLGLIIKEIDPRGTMTEFTYDERNRRIRETVQTATGDVTHETQYDNASNVVQTIEPLGNVTSFAYDELNRLTEKALVNNYTASNGTTINETYVTRYAYNDNSGSNVFDSELYQPTLVIDPRFHAVKNEYDNAYRHVSVRRFANPVNPTTFALPAASAVDQVETYTLDSNGNIAKTSVENPLGTGPVVTRIVYDHLDRPVRTQIELDGEPDIIRHTVYDNAGNIAKQVDPEGNLTLTECNTLGLPAKTVRRVDGTVSFTNSGVYPFKIDTTTIHDNDITTTYEYDGRGNLFREILRRIDYSAGVVDDIVSETHYDALNRPVTLIQNSDQTAAEQADEKIIRYTYDLNGNRRFERIRREDYVSPGTYIQIETEFEYDELNRLTRTTLPPVFDPESNADVNATILRSWDKNSNLTRVTNPRGMVTDYEYDGINRRVRTIQHSDGNAATDGPDEIATRVEYDENNNIVESTLRRIPAFGSATFVDVSTTTVYDAFNRPIQVTDAENNVTTTKYDNVGNVIAITDPRSNTTDFTYDRANRRIKMEQPAVDAYATGSSTAFQTNIRPTWTYEYDRRSLFVRETDPNARSTYYTYDAVDRLVQTINPLGDSITTVYDQANNVKSITDFRGHTTTTTFDRLNRPVSETDAANFTTATEYDLTDNIKQVTDAKANPAIFVYDLRGRQIRALRRGNTLEIVSTFNLNDAPVSVTDENGNTTTTEYDLLDRPVKRIDPEGNETQTAYDHANNVIHTIDPEGNTVTTAYDKINRVIAVEEALGKVTQYEYDKNSNRTKITDANGFETLFEYDAGNRMTQHQFPTSDAYEYRYDFKRNVVRIINPNGQAVFRTYDALDRPITLTYPGHDYAYTYDANSNPLNTIHQITLPGGATETWETARTWNNRDLLSSMTCAYPGLSQRTYTCTYDANRVPETKVTPNGRTIDYQTNARDLFTQISADLGTGPLTAVFTYDETDRQATKLYNNQTTRTYTYDNRNLLLQMANTHTATDANLLTNDYHYNSIGYKTYEAEIFDGGAMSSPRSQAELYQYDSLYRVTGVKDGVDYTPVPGSVSAANKPAPINFLSATATAEQTYDFDLLENRKTVTKTISGTPTTTAYNAASGSYTPDPVNRINDIDGTVYTYGANGNLATDPPFTYTWSARNELESVDNGGTQVVRYVYDEDGRRLAKITPTGSTYYYWQDWDVSLEVDQTDTVTAEYLPGRTLDEPIAAVIKGLPASGTGQTLYFHQNSLGHVMLISDASGEVIERYDYDIYGNASVLDANGTLQPAAISQSPYLFTGRRFDPDTGLYYFRNRYYSASVGRFISHDPLDYVDGMNIYAYVNGNVVNMVDPLGLYRFDIFGWDFKIGESDDYALVVDAEVAGDLVTGAQATGNAAVDTGVGFVTLGQADPLHVFGGETKEGYAAANGFSRVGFELLFGVATGGMSTASKVSKAFVIIDTAGNAVSAGQGMADIAENGVTAQNAFQTVASLAGVTGNVAGARTASRNTSFLTRKHRIRQEATTARIGRDADKTLSGNTLNVGNKSTVDIDRITSTSGKTAKRSTFTHTPGPRPQFNTDGLTEIQLAKLAKRRPDLLPQGFTPKPRALLPEATTPKSTTKLLTGSTKLADHHLFPRQFQKFFKSNGVNIDDFTVTVDHNVTHLKGIHGKGNLGQMPGKWNKAWADFIRNNPNASQKQIFQQAGKMMDEFGIGHLPIHKFKN